MSAAVATRRNWLGLYLLAYLVFLYLPVALIPLFSFNNSIQAAFPLQGFTLDWYRALADNEPLRMALVTSLQIGISAATIATLCGITIAYMDVFGKSKLALAVSAIARLPILIPGVIIGIALLILVNLAGLGPSRMAIVAGHVLAALPTTVVIMRGRFTAIPKSIPEAAEDLLRRASAFPNQVVGVYLVESAIDDRGRAAPDHFREVFRTRGPSNYPQHGRQAERSDV